MSATHGLDTGIIKVCTEVGSASKISTPNQPLELKTEKKGAKIAKAALALLVLTSIAQLIELTLGRTRAGAARG